MDIDESVTLCYNNFHECLYPYFSVMSKMTLKRLVVLVDSSLLKLVYIQINNTWSFPYRRGYHHNQLQRVLFDLQMIFLLVLATGGRSEVRVHVLVSVLRQTGHR